MDQILIVVIQNVERAILREKVVGDQDVARMVMSVARLDLLNRLANKKSLLLVEILRLVKGSSVKTLQRFRALMFQMFRL